MSETKEAASAELSSSTTGQHAALLLANFEPEPAPAAVLQKHYVNYLNKIPALNNVNTDSHCCTCRMCLRSVCTWPLLAMAVRAWHYNTWTCMAFHVQNNKYHNIILEQS